MLNNDSIVRRLGMSMESMEVLLASSIVDWIAFKTAACGMSNASHSGMEVGLICSLSTKLYSPLILRCIFRPCFQETRLPVDSFGISFSADTLKLEMEMLFDDSLILAFKGWISKRFLDGYLISLDIQ